MGFDLMEQNQEQGPVEEIVHAIRIDKPAFKRWMAEHQATLADEFGQNPDIYFEEEGDTIVIIEKPSTTRKASMIEAIQTEPSLAAAIKEEE